MTKSAFWCKETLNKVFPINEEELRDEKERIMEAEREIRKEEKEL